MVATHPDYRGRGYSELTLRYLIDVARGRGSPFAFLHVDLENERAQRVYERLGFAGLERVLIDYPDKSKSLMMTRMGMELSVR